jgi:hypothetical protein
MALGGQCHERLNHTCRQTPRGRNKRPSAPVFLSVEEINSGARDSQMISAREATD